MESRWFSLSEFNLRLSRLPTQGVIHHPGSTQEPQTTDARMPPSRKLNSLEGSDLQRCIVSAGLDEAAIQHHCKGGFNDSHVRPPLRHRLRNVEAGL